MLRIKEKQLDLILSGSFTGSFIGSAQGDFSGSFQGDGSQLINIPASSISGLQLFRISSGSVSASVDNSSQNLFTISDSINDLFIVKNTGVVTFQNQTSLITPIEGGIMYSGSNFWLGFE